MSHRVLPAIVLALSLSIGCERTSVQSGAEDVPPDSSLSGTWRSRADMPIAVQEIQASVWNGKIIVVAGISVSNTVQTSVFVYDPTLDQWTSGPFLPKPRHHHAVVVVADSLYVVGGYEDPLVWQPSGEVFMLDLTSMQWSSRQSMPGRRGEHVAVVYHNTIHVLGGRDSVGADTNLHEVFDTGLWMWDAAPSMPSKRNHAAAVLVDSTIYVMGGRWQAPGGGSANQNLATLEAYALHDGSWMTLASMPTPRSGLMSGVLAGRIYAVGGEALQSGGGVAFTMNEEYSPQTNQWKMVRPLTVPRHGAAAATVGGEMFLLGGANAAGLAAVATVEVFTVAANEAPSRTMRPGDPH